MRPQRFAAGGIVAPVSDTLPTQHTAGDTYTATLSGATYAPADGWAAQLVLIGPQRITLAATVSGTDHAITADAATTAAWAPGDYSVRVVYTKASTGARSSATLGSLRLHPDPLASGTDAAALKSPARRALEDLEAAYRAHLSSGQVQVAEYQVAGRTMKFRTLVDLLKALNAARQDVAAETARERVAAGLSPRITYVTRM